MAKNPDFGTATSGHILQIANLSLYMLPSSVQFNMAPLGERRIFSTLSHLFRCLQNSRFFDTPFLSILANFRHIFPTLKYWRFFDTWPIQVLGVPKCFLI